MGGRVNSRGGADVAVLRRDLLRWFDRERRPLPWRADRDPYRVWVAEVMLQQTRIAVVAPAYERFLRVFPTLERLAAAAEEDVLAAWSGLGYYTRARSLHRAARQLAADGGSFPRDYVAARRLPGVGAYTAAAVLSIAYDEPHAAVDGNVVRVLSRLRRLGLPDSRGAPHATVAAALLEPRRPGDWNQAIMELGETICTPVGPQCGECPIGAHCEAHRRGVVHLHPPVVKRRAIEKLDVSMQVVRNRRDDVILERGVFPYLPEMWLPLVGEVTLRRGDVVREIRHAITHRSFRIKVVHRRRDGDAFDAVARQAAGRRVFTPRDLESIGRSSLLSKALEPPQ